MTIFFDVKLKKRFCLMTSNFQSFIQIFSLHKLNRFKRKMGVFNSCKSCKNNQNISGEVIKLNCIP